MKKADKDNLIGKLNKKFKRIEDAEDALSKVLNLNSSSPLYSNFLISISKYVGFIEESPLLNKLSTDLLKLGMNERGNYPKTKYGFSYKKLSQLNLAFQHEDKIPPAKIKWSMPGNEILSINKAKQLQRIYHTLFKQIENGTYNDNNLFRPELHLELFEHAKRVHIDLLDSVNEVEINEEVQLNQAESFRRYQPSKGEVEFGDGFFINPVGHVFRTIDGELVLKIGPSGHYLLRTLKQGGVNKALGNSDFKPKNKDARFSWSTMIRAKSDILKVCGQVIGTNASGQYWYCYKSSN